MQTFRMRSSKKSEVVRGSLRPLLGCRFGPDSSVHRRTQCAPTAAPGQHPLEGPGLRHDRKDPVGLHELVKVVVMGRHRPAACGCGVRLDESGGTHHVPRPRGLTHGLELQRRRPAVEADVGHVPTPGRMLRSRPQPRIGEVDGDELAWPGAEWASCCRGRTRSVNERRDGVRSVRRTTGESGQVPPSPFGVEREAVEAQVPGVAPGQNERNLEDQVGRVDAG